jgi:hypothetical protein
MPVSSLPGKSKVYRLARALLRNHDKQPSSAPPYCFTCGRTFARGEGRFCSCRCRAVFDAGKPTYKPVDINYTLPKGRHGFLIDCAYCRKQFDSVGLRCCSLACEREHHRKQEIEAKLTNDPLRAPPKRKCLTCGGDIPNWRTGRRVSKATKFCSPKCQKRSARKNAGMALGSPTSLLSGQTAKKCPKNKDSQPVVWNPSTAAGAPSPDPAK